MRFATAMALITVALGPCAGEVDTPAERIGVQIEVMPGPTISFADVSMPWLDYSTAPPLEVQRAIDACLGAVLYWEWEGSRMFAAHNRSCPPDRSFSKVRLVDEVVVDGLRFHLRTRSVYPAESVIVPPVWGLPAVSLQTSVGPDAVEVSWFTQDS